MTRLPAEPLLAAVRARGGPSAVGAKKRTSIARAYFRAQQTGRLTEAAADQLATKLLGLTLWEVYGDVA